MTAAQSHDQSEPIEPIGGWSDGCRIEATTERETKSVPANATEVEFVSVAAISTMIVTEIPAKQSATFLWQAVPRRPALP